MEDCKRKTVLGKIKDAYKTKRLIPFVGSGFSAQVAPNWDNFVENLFNDDRDVVAEINDNLELLEYFVIKKSKNELIERIDELLTFAVTWINDKPIVKVNNTEYQLDTHHLLCEKFKDQIIYTTNWDNLIEEVGHLKAIISRNDTLKNGCKIGVIKFHGSVGYNKNRDCDKGFELVACKSDYWRRISNITPFDILFQSDYVRNYYLFLGYSLRDINVSLTIYQLMKLINSNRKKNMEKRIFWAVTEPRNDKRVKVLSNFSCITPYYLLSKTEESKLDTISNEIKLKCKECNIVKISFINNMKNLNPHNVCRECTVIKDIKKRYDDEWSKYIENGTKRLLNHLKIEN